MRDSSLLVDAAGRKHAGGGVLTDTSDVGLLLHTSSPELKAVRHLLS